MARLPQNRLISKDMENPLQGISSLGFDTFSKLFLLGSCYKITDNGSCVDSHTSSSCLTVQRVCAIILNVALC